MKFEITESRFGKKQSKSKKYKQIIPVLIVIILVTLFILFSVIFAEMIRCNINKLSVDNNTNATWIGSLASYWGGIIGGIFSGIIAIIGVFYTIQFTREADRKKERQGIQPFLNIEIAKIPFSQAKSFQIVDNESSTNEVANNGFCKIYLSITNIGNGFAKTLTFGTGENFAGVEFSEVFTVNERKEILLSVQTSKLEEEIEFFIWFVDSMTNEYIQCYKLKQDKTGTGFSLDIGYPDYIKS